MGIRQGRAKVRSFDTSLHRIVVTMGLVILHFLLSFQNSDANMVGGLNLCNVTLERINSILMGSGCILQ
jgi:hypothetical protein